MSGSSFGAQDNWALRHAQNTITTHYLITLPIIVDFVLGNGHGFLEKFH